MQPQPSQLAPLCLYPPRIADEVDVTQQVEDGITRYVVRNRATARYFLLKQNEYTVFCRIDGRRHVAEIAAGGPDQSYPRVSPQALIKFLTKLDSFGLIAREGAAPDTASTRPQRGLYIKFHLFDPDRLLAWIDRKIGWALTRPFITGSFVLMLFVTIALLARADEVAVYSAYTYAQYGLSTILVFTLTITALHELAHGLACKHFGGDVRELGVLMIFYLLPAFYCNVTDIYRLGRKRERLWVIGAGIYWQLLVSAAGALVWLVAAPYTALADFCFLTFIGGTLNIIVNCNPLIKLDGYYALSQALGIQNLQAYSSEYVRSLVGRAIGQAPARSSAPRRPVLFISYWVCSILYSFVLIWVLVGWAGGWLMDKLGFVGVLLTLIIAALLTEKWWKPIFVAIKPKLASLFALSKVGQAESRARDQLQQDEGKAQGESVMSAAQQQADRSATLPEAANASARRRWMPSRRRLIKGAVLLALVAVMIFPWEASTGSDCALLLPPGREGVARANTDAVLTEIYVQPGDAVAEGARIARFINPELEDRLTQLNAEITRLDTNASRIEEELRVRSEMLLSASFKETERRRLAEELKNESIQISNSGVGGWGSGVTATQPGKPPSNASRPPATDSQPPTSAPRLLPASLAVLQSEIELKQTELEHNRREVERYKKLFEQGLVGSQQYDRAVAAMKVTEKELDGARARLQAALVEHRRQTSGAETSSLVAETEARAARSSFEALIADLHSNRQQLESLRQRREIFQREYDAMTLTALQSGVVLGEDLRKMIGRRYNRGEEVLRIGDLNKFLLKIDVSEREIASVRLDSPVRFKLKTVPGRTFTGRVSKINAEPVPNQYGQRFYPVEVEVENADGFLRPGMTGFARISFGRQSIGLILAEKLRQALRPELWLF